MCVLGLLARPGNDPYSHGAACGDGDRHSVIHAYVYAYLHPFSDRHRDGYGDTHSHLKPITHP